MSKSKGMMLGALAGTLIASAYTLFNTRESLRNWSQQTQDWADKAKNVRDNVLDVRYLTESRRNRGRKTFMQGAILGLLLGAGSAVLLSTKSGKQWRHQLSDRYQDVADKTQDIVKFINQNGYRKPLKKLTKSLIKRRHRHSARTR
jgi:gas vesicle protein